MKVQPALVSLTKGKQVAYAYGTHCPVSRGAPGIGASAWQLTDQFGVELPAQVRTSRARNHFNYVPYLMAIKGVLEDAEPNSEGVILTNNEAAVFEFKRGFKTSSNPELEARFVEIRRLIKEKGLERWTAVKCDRNDPKLRSLAVLCDSAVLQWQRAA